MCLCKACAKRDDVYLMREMSFRFFYLPLSYNNDDGEDEEENVDEKEDGNKWVFEYSFVIFEAVDNIRRCIIKHIDIDKSYARDESKIRCF